MLGRALCAAVGGVDRLVLLGDVIELRQGPVRDALPPLPPLAEVGEALRPSAEVVVVPGNHDHHLVDGWITRRAPPASGGRSGWSPRSTGGAMSRWPRWPSS